MSQFHYGSIKTKQKEDGTVEKTAGLNSTMVRLKQAENGEEYVGDYKVSQFHYGSIKTVFGSSAHSRNNRKSQFHYGSIKTFLHYNNLHESLKASQFHYGSIKTKS